MSHHYGTADLLWKGDTLTVIGRNSPSVEVVPDDKWPGMWRVKMPDGTLTDMVNRPRARDGAKSILLSILMGRGMPDTAPPMRLIDPALVTVAPEGTDALAPAVA